MRSEARALFILSLLICGCQTIHVREPLPDNWAANDDHAHSEFWYSLTHRPVISYDEAFHGILLYMDKTDASPNYAARVQTLRSRGMLPKDFSGERDAAADRGTLAVALAQALHIRGGVTMWLTGVTPRYAVRALEFRGIYPLSSPNQIFTGGAFVGVMQKAEEYELGSPADAPASVMPGQVRHPAGPPLARAAISEPVAADPPPSVFASSVIHPESLNLAYSPPPQAVIYLDTGVDETPDAPARAENSGLDDRVFALADPAPAAPDAAGSPMPETAPPTGAPRRLRAVVTAVEGDNAEVRVNPTAEWAKCEVGMIVRQGAEFRTGPKSSVQFIIQPDQTITLDSNGSISVLDASAQGNKVTTDVGLEHGRVRYDLARPGAGAGPETAPALREVRIEEAGLEHDALVRSPHAALALRGTEVSLFEQEGFDPEAMSLTGRALYLNTLGQTVAFGARRPALIRGRQTSAVQQALIHSSPPQSLYLSRTDFETREIAIVIQNGGFVVGNVLVGNLSLSDFPTLPNGNPRLPGALDFVLQWSGSPQVPLNDLNLAVFSPLHTASNPDFVSNPPFIYSLNPNSPTSKAIIAASYPSVSRSGGRITQNSVGPDGLEIAYWPKGFPIGNYRAFVFDLVDAKPPPTTVTNPVTYSIDVYLNGQHIYSNTGLTIGFLQTSGGIQFAIPPATPSPAIAASPKAAVRNVPAARAGHGKPAGAVSTASPTSGHPPQAAARTSTH